MNIKRFCALICGVIIIISSFSACTVKGDLEIETEFKTEQITEKEATTAVKETAGKKYVVKTNDGSPLNLRAGAGTDYDVLATIENGETITILNQQGSWAKVKHGEFTGWVNTEFIEQETQVTQTETTVTKQDKNKTTATQVSSQTSPGAAKPQSGYIYSYAGFNPVEITIKSDSWNLTLLNRHYTLPEGYVPQLAEAVKGSGVYLDYRVAPHYQKMYDAALKDGITLSPNSGYRSYQLQKNNFENKINYYMSQGYDKATAAQNASRVILLPGTSEHNAGLAMDIGWVTEDFENSSAFAWLSAHAQDYGFIMRYPKSENKQAITEIIYEPWHWRYVGVEAAKEMKASGQVLEEYLGVK